MRRLLLSAAALAGLVALGATHQADAAVSAGLSAPVTSVETASPEVQTVQYYHHRYYRHRFYHRRYGRY